MSQYRNAPPDKVATMKRIIEDCKPYLAKNDLVGMYEYLNNSGWSHQCEGDKFGYITEFLEDCGIDTVSAVKPAIPPLFCIYADVPKSLLGTTAEDIGILSFPRYIKEIGRAAFFNSHGFISIDLRGLTKLGYQCFGNLPDVDTIIVDTSIVSLDLDRNAFDMTDIKRVVVYNMDKNIAKGYLKDTLTETNSTPFEHIKWVEM